MISQKQTKMLTSASAPSEAFIHREKGSTRLSLGQLGTAVIDNERFYELADILGLPDGNNAKIYVIGDRPSPRTLQDAESFGSATDSTVVGVSLDIVNGLATSLQKLRSAGNSRRGSNEFLGSVPLVPDHRRQRETRRASIGDALRIAIVGSLYLNYLEKSKQTAPKRPFTRRSSAARSKESFSYAEQHVLISSPEVGLPAARAIRVE